VAVRGRWLGKGRLEIGGWGSATWAWRLEAGGRIRNRANARACIGFGVGGYTGVWYLWRLISAIGGTLSIHFSIMMRSAKSPHLTGGGPQGEGAQRGSTETLRESNWSSIVSGPVSGGGQIGGMGGGIPAILPLTGPSPEPLPTQANAKAPILSDGSPDA
jgi:hypothetical protein